MRRPRVALVGTRRAKPADADGHEPRPARSESDVFTRHPLNPILEAEDLPFDANAVFNPGATIVDGGETLLLVRIEDRRGLSHLHVARSKDGVTNWRVEEKPLLSPEPGSVASAWGYEDARLVHCRGDSAVGSSRARRSVPVGRACTSRRRATS